MIKVAATLLIGAALGYWFGFSDAKQHSENMVARAVTHVADWQREKVSNDIDKRTEGMEP